MGKRVGELKSSAWDHLVIGVYQGRFARQKMSLAEQPEYQAFPEERGKDGSEKGRELPPALSPLPSPPSKISSPLASQEGLILRLLAARRQERTLRCQDAGNKQSSGRVQRIESRGHWRLSKVYFNSKHPVSWLPLYLLTVQILKRKL